MLKIEPQLNKIKRSFKVKDENIHLVDAKHFIQEENPLEICEIIDQLIQ